MWQNCASGWSGVQIISINCALCGQKQGRLLKIATLVQRMPERCWRSMKEHATRLGKLILDHFLCLSKIGDARAINPRHQLAGIKVADPLYVCAILDPASSSTTHIQGIRSLFSKNGPSKPLPR